MMTFENTIDLPEMQPGELRQFTQGNWTIEMIYQTDGRLYIAGQRETPTRRMFDVTGDSRDAVCAAAGIYVADCDIADGVISSP